MANPDALPTVAGSLNMADFDALKGSEDYR
jgi:hypothetical protein